MTISVNLSTLVMIAAVLVAVPVWRWLVWKHRRKVLMRLKAKELANMVTRQMLVGIGIVSSNQSQSDDEFPEIIEDKK